MPSETVVDAWLREAARLSAESRMASGRVDMSPEAVTRRLREVAEMSRLCLDLAASRPVRASDDGGPGG